MSVRRSWLGAWGLGAVLWLSVGVGALHGQGTAGKKVSVSGGWITYFDLGAKSGVPLVLVSGGPGFASDYFAFVSWAPMSGRRRIVRYDQRGTGEASPVGSKDAVTVAQFVADIEALRTALGVSKIDLLGHSWGGYLSMAYAKAHGDRLAHLILLDAAAPKFSETRFLFKEAFPDRGDFSGEMARGVEGDTVALARGLKTYVSSIFYAPENAERFLQQMGPLHFNRFQHKQLATEMGATDLSPAVRQFKIPTLVVTGRYDMNVAPITAFQIHQMIAGSQFVVFEKSSHMPFYEERERFLSVVEQFLTR